MSHSCGGSKEINDHAAGAYQLRRRREARIGNSYRTKAYARAAESLGTLTVPLAEIVRERRLREIPGVGEAIADIITRLHQTGTGAGSHAQGDSVLEMLTVPGLRPEKVMKLFKELGAGGA